MLVIVYTQTEGAVLREALCIDSLASGAHDSFADGVFVAFGYS